jgi:hypothetical protein
MCQPKQCHGQMVVDIALCGNNHACCVRGTADHGGMVEAVGAAEAAAAGAAGQQLLPHGGLYDAQVCHRLGLHTVPEARPRSSSTAASMLWVHFVAFSPVSCYFLFVAHKERLTEHACAAAGAWRRGKAVC